MLKTIFFDLGNVLVFFDHSKMYNQMALCTGLSQEAVQKILIDEKIGEQYEAGKINSLSIYQYILSRSPKWFHMEDLFEATSNIFTPNKSLFPIIEKLKEQGIQLILLSNTSECHWERIINTYPILDCFDDYILSFKVGALKPSKEIFLDALSKATCNVKNCFYTDDVPKFIEGAKKVGLDGEVFTGASSLKKALSSRGISFL